MFEKANGGEKKKVWKKVRVDVCFASMRHSFAVDLIFFKSPSSGSHDHISMLVTGWNDLIGVLVKTPVKGIPIPSLPPHLPPFP